MGTAARRKKEKRASALGMNKTARPGQAREAVISGDKGIQILGSDIRSRVVNECLLCGAVAPLLLGHVAPRWAALWAKREGYILGNYASIGVQTKKQDFPKHYFFCAVCEQHLGLAENYLSRLSRGTEGDLARIGVTLNLKQNSQVSDAPLPEITGLNATLLMRALAGIALKAHLSPHQVYRHQHLSKGEATALRGAILNDVYKEDRYAVYAQKLMNRTVPGANPRTGLYIVFVRKHGGVLVNLLMAGFVWSLFLGPAERLREDHRLAKMPDLFFESGKPWSILPSEWAFDPIAVSGAGINPDDYEFGRLLRPTDPCPCGLDSTFVSCCSDRWLPAVSPTYVRRGSPPVF